MRACESDKEKHAMTAEQSVEMMWKRVGLAEAKDTQIAQSETAVTMTT